MEPMDNVASQTEQIKAWKTYCNQLEQQNAKVKAQYEEVKAQNEEMKALLKQNTAHIAMLMQKFFQHEVAKNLDNQETSRSALPGIS